MRYLSLNWCSFEWQCHPNSLESSSRDHRQSMEELTGSNGRGSKTPRRWWHCSKSWKGMISQLWPGQLLQTQWLIKLNSTCILYIHVLPSPTPIILKWYTCREKGSSPGFKANQRYLNTCTIYTLDLNCTNIPVFKILLHQT